VKYPPNPNRSLDNSLTPDQAAGQDLFNATNCGIPTCLDPTNPNCHSRPCSNCHVLDQNGNAGSVASPGFFGTMGLSTFAFNPQLFKIPHLRNLYQKVGMFGNPPNPGFLPGDNDFTGDQVRGFGFIHDGTVDTIFRFHHGISFSVLATGPGNGGLELGPVGDVKRRQLEQFVLAFPSNFAPIVGQQITLDGADASVVGPRIDLLIQRADAKESDLIAKALVAGEETGFLYTGQGQFTSDRSQLPPFGDAILRLVATQLGFPVTYTCVPPGSGVRLGIDRDGDGYLDGDERDGHSDPADRNSTPHS
jgi:hypothetical protein